MIVSISQCPGALRVSTVGGRYQSGSGFCCYWHHWAIVCDIFDLGEVDTYRGFHRGADPDVPVRTAMRDLSWRVPRFESCAHDKVPATFAADVVVAFGRIRLTVQQFWVVVANGQQYADIALADELVDGHNDRWEGSCDATHERLWCGAP